VELDPSLVIEARKQVELRQQQARRHQALARRARRRAKLDMAVIALATGLATMLGQGTHEALMAGSTALSFGILFYVIRRDRDLTALAGQGRWREDALEGRGLPLEAWRSGASLDPWEARRGRPIVPQDR
jgi:hypothetical protein